jgi:hypothetical protein
MWPRAFGSRDRVTTDEAVEVLGASLDVEERARLNAGDMRDNAVHLGPKKGENLLCHGWWWNRDDGDVAADRSLLCGGPGPHPHGSGDARRIAVPQDDVVPASRRCEAE